MEIGGWKWEDGDGEDGDGRMEIGGWSWEDGNGRRMEMGGWKWEDGNRRRMELGDGNHSNRIHLQFPISNFLSPLSNFPSPLSLLFRFQALHRIHQGGFYGLVAYCKQSNYQSSCSCGHKYPPADFCPVSIFLQPFVHKIIGDWCGY
jgi:hypothetical protein